MNRSSKRQKAVIYGSGYKLFGISSIFAPCEKVQTTTSTEACSFQRPDAGHADLAHGLFAFCQ